MDFFKFSSTAINLLGTLLLAALVWFYYRYNSSYPDMKYSTFWPRFWAPTFDELVLWPFTSLLPLIFIPSLSPDSELPLPVTTAIALLQFTYSITCHGAFGATLGKRICKVRVVDARTEKTITYGQAFLRDSVPMIMIFCFLAYSSLFPQPADLEKQSPALIITGIFVAWFLAEILTMLTNQKRRALHDFLAGTVVIRTDIRE
jgi:uncharacterized RDD family membrane protein YckC